MQHALYFFSDVIFQKHFDSMSLFTACVVMMLQYGSRVGISLVGVQLCTLFAIMHCCINPESCDWWCK
jgi:hypothetical protein